MKRKRKPTLEDHVNSIIADGGPDGALKKRYQYDFLEEILDEIHSRKKLLDLRAYHFKGTVNMWSEEDSINYELARQATGELIETLKEKYAWNDEQVIENITAKHFHKETIKYGVRVAGMLTHVYENSPSQAVTDYFQNHPNEKTKNKFKDLKEYHFKAIQKHLWTKKDGTKNYELARQATGEFLDTLKERYGWDYEQVIENIRAKHFLKEPIKYNATLSGMLRVYNHSPSQAVIDFLQHHPNEEIRNKFKDLKEYHFGRVQNMWTKKDGTKNYELARQATGELIKTLKGRHAWNDKQAIQNLGYDHFYEEPIRFNTKLGGMLQNVYDNSPSAARQDYLKQRK